jgi:hypothetical protein
VSVASFDPGIESTFRFGGTGQCDELPADAIDEAAAEWSALQAQQGSDLMEHGPDLVAMRDAMLAERDRLLAELTVGGVVSIDRSHELSYTDGVLRSRWQVMVWTHAPTLGRPGLCGVGSHEQSLTAAGDEALSDLRTKAVAAISQASGVLPAGHPVSLVAVVAAEGRAA